LGIGKSFKTPVIKTSTFWLIFANEYPYATLLYLMSSPIFKTSTDSGNPRNWFDVLLVYVTIPATLAVGNDKDPLVGNPTVVSTVRTVDPSETESVIRVLPGTTKSPSIESFDTVIW